MTEYIEREAAKSAIYEIMDKYDPYDRCDSKSITALQRADEAIDSIPAADVVPVVRCRECRYAYDSVGGWCCSHGICVDCVVREDFFCADGASMDGET